MPCGRRRSSSTRSRPATNWLAARFASIARSKNFPTSSFSTGISTPGIDGYISLRGIPGGTQQLIDGHPTSVSLNSVALFPFQSVDVVYGSGKGQLYPINAIGGVIDLRTLQPTRTPTVSYLQSFGTFSKLTSDLQSTGTFGKFGYAFSFGTEGLDAPYARSTRYEPLSGWDPTATDPAVRKRSFYALDSPMRCVPNSESSSTILTTR